MLQPKMAALLTNRVPVKYNRELPCSRWSGAGGPILSSTINSRFTEPLHMAINEGVIRAFQMTIRQKAIPTACLHSKLRGCPA